MILFFTNSLIKKTQEVNVSLGDFNQEEEKQNSNVVMKMAPGPVPASCVYPIDIPSLFPRWLQKISTSGNSNLIELTKRYYNWLVCESYDINSVGFLDLESINDIENMPDSYVKYMASTYLPSINPMSINYPGYSDGNIDHSKIRLLLDNIKINLYSRKGSKDSYVIAINELFDILPENINISYPKKFVMRLNGGRYDWMGLETTQVPDTIASITPELTSSFLNFSVLSDNSLWQDYSYVVNVAGLSLDAYNNVIRPLLHPAGTADFFEIREDIFNNNSETIHFSASEIPVIRNYRGYTLGSSTSLSSCSQGAGYRTFVFPSWDIEISSHSGVTFGNINIDDFLLLTPQSGSVYPNESLVQQGMCV